MCFKATKEQNDYFGSSAIASDAKVSKTGINYGTGEGTTARIRSFFRIGKDDGMVSRYKSAEVAKAINVSDPRQLVKRLSELVKKGELSKDSVGYFNTEARRRFLA